MRYGCCFLPMAAPLPMEGSRLLAVRLRQIPGILSVSVEADKLTLYYRGRLPQDRVCQYLAAFMVYYGVSAKPEAVKLAEYRRDALISAGGFIVMQILKKASPLSFASLKILRSVLVLVIARGFIHNGVCGMLRNHQANADTLTATAVVASVLAGKPESSLTLLALSNGAEMLTSYAAEKARKHISGFLSLDQRFVWLVENGHEHQVPIETVKVGDVIAVHTGEKICVDGHVRRGNAAVNQSSITGESNPAIKGTAAPVYAGSVLEAGELEIQVEKVGKDTSLAHIIHLVEEAQTRKAPVQNFANRMANLLVPVSFLGAAIVYGATRDWQRVLNLLFIDFSCGLKLSTATAISAAIGMSAQKGILVKGGNYIEALAETDTVVLDKTGTITLGVPQISMIETAPQVSEQELILLAASAELHSVHPLAVAIQKYVQEKGWNVPQHASSKTIVARGMAARVPAFDESKGGNVLVGSRRFMEEKNVQDLERISGQTLVRNVLYVARNRKLIGVIGIDDPIRPQMKKTLNQMRRYGIDEIVMLTGDSEKVAAEVARDMDIDSYYAEILPEDKAAHVMKLKKHGNVMMVGDGINDAPALAFADVGVTMGGRQTDLAVESSAVTIRSEDPGKLVDALQISRRTMKLIHQNFTATITVNSAAMLLGALGRINPLWAAIIHNAATLAVVLNSARILHVTSRSRIL